MRSPRVDSGSFGVEATRRGSGSRPEPSGLDARSAVAGVPRRQPGRRLDFERFSAWLPDLPTRTPWCDCGDNGPTARPCLRAAPRTRRASTDGHRGRAGLLALPVLFGAPLTGTGQVDSIILNGEGAIAIGGGLTTVAFAVAGAIALLVRRGRRSSDEPRWVTALRPGIMMFFVMLILGLIGRHSLSIDDQFFRVRATLGVGAGRAALWAFVLTTLAVLIATLPRTVWESPPAGVRWWSALRSALFATSALLIAGLVLTAVSTIVFRSKQT